MTRQTPLVRRAAAVRAALLAGLVLVCALAAPAAGQARPDRDDPLVAAIGDVTRSTNWTLTERIPLDFETYHPQGLARVGDRLFLSSVEIIEPPVRYPQPVDGYDRSPGRGRGHLFVLGLDGTLIQDIVLGEGTMYHPGGIDTDGTSLWVPVAEYRPYSDAIVYRVDLRTLRVSEAFRVDDHVGGVVAEPERGLVHGVTWGSREFYTWTTRGRELDHAENESHFIDYQDCAYVRRGNALCTGVTGFTTASGGSFELGGAALLDLRTREILHEVPIQRWSAAGHVVTRNPVHLEADEDGTLRMWAAPDDGEERSGTELLLYTA
jgi:hypothetical protein